MTAALSAPDLWAAARAMLAALYALVGPATIQALAALPRKQRREALDWLKPLEIMVRKLLLLEARTLEPARPRPIAAPPRKLHRARTRPPIFALAPADMRLSALPPRITLLGGARTLQDIRREQARAARIAQLRAAAPASAHARLANRIAALARVLARPLAAARRLARLLRRHGQALIARIARAFTPVRPILFRIRDYDEASARVRSFAGDTS